MIKAGICAVALVALAFFWFLARISIPLSVVPLDVESLYSRAHLVSNNLAKIGHIYRSEIVAIERIVRRTNPDSSLARRIAWEIVLQANRAEVPVQLIVGLLKVENSTFDPRAKSSAGAVGLAQVMPFHAGKWDPCGPNLQSVRDNLCTGVQILRKYLELSKGRIEEALLRYNGCVTGSHTPNCFTFPTKVLAEVGRVSLELDADPD